MHSTFCLICFETQFVMICTCKNDAVSSLQSFYSVVEMLTFGNLFCFLGRGKPNIVLSKALVYARILADVFEVQLLLTPLQSKQRNSECIKE